MGGETVVVVGCGPVGLMAQKSAWIKGAGRVIGLDTKQYRLDRAKATAGSETILVEKPDDTVALIRELTDGRGADVCIDAVGMEPDMTRLEKIKAVINIEAGSIDALRLALSAVRRGGKVISVGVYGTPFDNFPLGQMFEKGITWKGGQVPVQKYIDELLQLVVDRKVVLDDIISHRLPLDKAKEAYHIFNQREDDCVKVVLKP
jgi:alcohol dehydrogenase